MKGQRLARFSSSVPGAARAVRQLSRRGVLRGAGCAAMAVTLAGCGGSGPTLYTLSVVPGAVVTPAEGAAGAPAYIEVRQPSVASGLDRDRVVTADSGYKLDVSAGDAWADSLAGQVSRVLAGDLAQRLPRSNVFVENDAVTAEPQAYVELSLSRFSTGPSGLVELDAILSVQPAMAGVPAGQSGTAGVPPFIQRVTLQGPAASSTVSMVQALSQLVGQVADLAAQRLSMLPASRPVSPHAETPPTRKTRAR
ncbi:PqiC family protein [Acetobacter sp. TBRC 12305]|uniref:Membrane integrity-associated transporter subunit PqiC n=2 Tax=Acetobacter garciniae TaxID=2817435 RepID=A0A939KQ19_9PROT|nr:membrane integrity-associated transporter subunit PqiC [Acetobacter garciniae]MBX0344435.1 PqiC family protein [Acetobacter garciniae]